DWLLWGKEVEAISKEFWATIDTVLMGRKTYEVARGTTKSKKSPYPGVMTYVFSRTLTDDPAEGVAIIAEDAAGFVRGLKGREGKGICVMGGGELARSLLEGDVIDEIVFNIHPVLLGAGIPLFLPMRRQIDLELRECRTLKNGCVVVSY